MNSRVPAPPHAALIWSVGTQLAIQFPGAGAADGTGPSPSHTIFIDTAKCSVECSSWGEPLARQRGWAILLQLLRSRESDAAARRPSKIGTSGAITLYALESALRSGAAVRRFAPSGAPAATSLADLGLEED